MLFDGNNFSASELAIGSKVDAADVQQKGFRLGVCFLSLEMEWYIVNMFTIFVGHHSMVS